MNKINRTSMIAITVFALIATGLIAIPALDQQQQAHASIFKDSANKVKNLIKHVVNKIFNRGGGETGGGTGGGCPGCF